MNISLSWVDPSTMFRYYAIDSFSPTNFNWGHFRERGSHQLLKQAQATFDEAEQTKLLAQAHTSLSMRRPGCSCARSQPTGDVGEGAGVPAGQSWFQDFTQIDMA